MSKIVGGVIMENGQVVGDYFLSGGDNLRDTVVNVIYPKVPQNDHLRTLKKDPYEFHYRYSGSRCFFAVVESGVKTRIAWAFLDEVEKEFMRISLAATKSIVKKIIQKQMNFYNDPNNDKITQLQHQVTDVRDVMIDNLDKVLDRGIKLDVIVEKSQDVAETAADFRRGTRAVKRSLGFKLALIISLIVIVLVVIIVAVVLIALGASGVFTQNKNKK